MKKMVRKSLGISIAVVMLFFLVSNYVLQINLSKNELRQSSQDLFWQIEQLLERNTTELNGVKADFKEQCLIRAKAAAYILQYHPNLLKSPQEIKKLTALLQIDEFHVFDTSGTIYAGSEPKYFGYTFNSGEQMNFFLPMLEDTSLELCQDITPNTAESKLMQYAAVWQENKQNIVQIGMEPDRVIELTEKNTLSHLFSTLVADRNTVLYAIDPESHEILGSTDTSLVGKHLADINISLEETPSENDLFFYRINGAPSFCIFHQSEDILLARSYPADSFYQAVNKSTFFLALYLAAIFAVMLTAISMYLDRNIITAFSDINKKLKRISSGNLTEQVNVHTTPEFTELSEYIDQMVESLLDSADKMSKLLDIVNLPIGAYEYGPDMDCVLITRRIPAILNLTEEEEQRILSSCPLFEEKLKKIQAMPFSKENFIYHLDCGTNRYVKIESFTKGTHTLGILLDVTDDVLEKIQIEQERDYDLLTGLYSRRAFYSQLEDLFTQPEKLTHSAIVMADADNLKYVNDYYGHSTGDRYLQGIAAALQSSSAPCQIVSRLSGDEFALLIYNCQSREELQSYLDELKAASSSKYMLNEEKKLEITLSFSVGFAFYNEDSTDFHALFKCADERMYEDKRRKKANKK